MNILLIRTPLKKIHLGFKGLIEIEPLHLEYLAGNLENCNVKIFDSWRHREKKLYSLIKNNTWDIVGFNSSAVHTSTVLKYAEYIKETDKNTLIVIGGEHPTLAPGYFNKPYIDIIVFGAGIKKFQEIVENCRNKKPQDAIKGIGLVKNGKIHFNEKENEPLKLDKCNFPDRSILAKERKSYFFYSIRSIATVVFSEGCPYSCNFCCVWRKHDGVNRRNPEKVLEELKTIKEKWIFYSDDNFMANETIELFLEELELSGIKKKFIVEASAELIIQNEQLVKKFAKLGLKAILIGLEAFDSKNLSDVNKTATVEQNIRALQILRENNIDCLASVILYPEWTKTEFDFLWQKVKEHKITWLHMQCLTPLPGTEFFEQTYSQITSFNLDLYDMEHMLIPSALPLKKYYRQMALLYFKTYNPIRFFKLKPNIKLPLNPIYKTFYYSSLFLIRLFNAHKHHNLRHAQDQIKNIDDITLRSINPNIIEKKQLVENM